MNTSLYSSNNSDNIFNEDLFDKLLLNKSLYEILGDLGHHPDNIFKEISLLNALLSKAYLVNNKLSLNDNSLEIFISEFINGKQISEYLMLNEFEGDLYYNKERFEELIYWFFNLSALYEIIQIKKKSKAEKENLKMSNSLKTAEKFISKIYEASENAQYKVKELKKNLVINEAAKKKPVKRIKKTGESKGNTKRQNKKSG